MKRRNLALIFFITFFTPASSIVWAQVNSDKAMLAAFEGTIAVFENNKPVKIRLGMDFSENTVIRAVGGIALLYFPADSLYGVIKDSTSTPGNCLKRPISDANLERIRTKTAAIMDIFQESAPPVESAPPLESAPPPEAALTAPANVNLILILDASTSMKNVFPEMQEYIFSLILEQQLKSGDYLSLFVFGAETTKVYSATLKLPEDRDSLEQAIFAVKPRQLATDIGAMLAELQDFITNEKLPNRKTVIIWATDGKNNPAASSPWAGRDIYQASAFSAYKIVKSAEYKVLLLSIGDDPTAAESLGRPLGGEVIKVGSDAKADAIGKLLADFADSIELMVPESIGRIRTLRPKISLGFLSTYEEAKTISIEKILVSVDGGSKIEVIPENRIVKIDGLDQTIVEYQLSLPRGLARGAHLMELEVAGEGSNVMKPLQQVKFTWAPFDYALAASAGGGAVGLAVFLANRKRRKDGKTAH